MPDTITKHNVEERCANVNRRMESRGSTVRYGVNSHSGSTHLYRFLGDEAVERDLPQDHITAGTKSEIADFLRAMMIALDDSVRSGTDV